MRTHYADGTIVLWQGDALAVLEQLPAESVDCVVTSPPYYGLRDYGNDGQYGLEDTPAAYVTNMRDVFEYLDLSLKTRLHQSTLDFV